MGLISEQSLYSLAAVDPRPCSRPRHRRHASVSEKRRCGSAGEAVHLKGTGAHVGIVSRPIGVARNRLPPSPFFASSVVERRPHPPAQRTPVPISTRRPQIVEADL